MQYFSQKLSRGYLETQVKNNSTKFAHNIFVKKFLFIFCVIALFFAVFPARGVAESFSEERIVFELAVDSQKFSFDENDLLKMFDGEKIPRNYGSLSNRQNVARRLESMGFDRRTILEYLFPGIERQIEKIYDCVFMQPQNSVVEFSGINARVKRGVVGVDFEIDGVFDDIFERVVEGKFLDISISTIKTLPDVVSDDLLPLMNLRGCFVTQIRGENQEGRKHNIKQALMQFYGKRIENGERVSFNSVIGNTTPQNGYALAKVIVNGKYEDDFGGGVCQASTTLYNALLISGVDIIQVRPHSLRVGYVEPSFDAMVSFGVSDLVFENNTGAPIFVTTFASGSACGAYVYGLQSDITISRRSEILERDDDTPENVNFKSKGVLEYYQGGSLIKTKNIRKDTYFVLKNS